MPNTIGQTGASQLSAAAASDFRSSAELQDTQLIRRAKVANPSEALAELLLGLKCPAPCANVVSNERRGSRARRRSAALGRRGGWSPGLLRVPDVSMKDKDPVVMDNFDQIDEKIIEDTARMLGPVKSEETGDTIDEERVQENNQWIARGVLLTCAALYGTNFASVKLLDEVLDPSMAAFLRFTLAAAIFAPPMFKKGPSNPALIFGGLEVGFYVWIGYVTQAFSLQTAQASIAAFICSLAVIVVPILDVLFPGEEAQVTPAPAQTGNPSRMPLDFNPESAKLSVPPAAEKISGILEDRRLNTFWPALVAATGVAFLELGGSSAPGIGDLWAVGQPVFFGLGFWRAEHYMRKCKEGEAEAFTGALLAAVAICSFFWTAHDWASPVLQHAAMQHKDVFAALGSEIEKLAPILQDWHVIAGLVWTGVVTTALTTYGENFALKSLSSAETTVIFSTEPLWGTAVAALTLGEHLGPNTFAGAFLIILACMWSSF